MTYLMSKHTEEFKQKPSLLTDSLQTDYFSATASGNSQNLLDQVDINDAHLKPARKLLLTPGNDLKEHQQKIVGIVEKKLAFNNP